MRNRIWKFRSRPAILSAASSVGKNEGEGPLGRYFDNVNENDGIGSSTWEKAEAALVKQAVSIVLIKAGVLAGDVDLVFAGDLLNHCTATTFGLRELSIPLAGLFGACSTFAMALCLGALAVDGGAAKKVLCGASSHFCSAEKQFRSPLEYGGQRAQTAQRTVTGAGFCLLGEGSGVKITKGMIGTVRDLGVKDAANMGAAMAPAAAETIGVFLRQTETSPADYDRIVTGDLGQVGSTLLLQLMREDYGLDISGKHEDCGLVIFDAGKQDVHAGGSGCGCSAAVVSSYILRQMRLGEMNRVLFVGTGALMSPLTTLQGESIPSVAHAVLLENEV